MSRENLAFDLFLSSIAGVIATFFMIIVEAPLYLRWGMQRVLEWHENQVIASRILSRTPESSVGPGLGLHVFHGLLGGLVFGSFLSIVPSLGPPLPLGIFYGLVLWLIGLGLYQPITRVSSLHHPLGWSPVLASLMVHIVYGAVLGGLVSIL